MASGGLSAAMTGAPRRRNANTSAGPSGDLPRPRRARLGGAFAGLLLLPQSRQAGGATSRPGRDLPFSFHGQPLGGERREQGRPGRGAVVAVRAPSARALALGADSRPGPVREGGQAGRRDPLLSPPL